MCQVSSKDNNALVAGQLRIKDIEDIYFFEVNTKYISSNILKISVISGVRSTSEITDFFNIFDEIILVFAETKSKFSFYFFRLGANLTFS